MDSAIPTTWPLPEHDLLKELLDDLSENPITESTAIEFSGDRVNPLVVSGAGYSGPTIEDIENALSVVPRKELPQEITPLTFSLLERGVSKIEHKYTLRMKSCGNNLLADDGYKWRKYGQKSIKNSPNPRSYYRCSNPRCSAKKQVERSIEDPETFIITYEGLHLHFAYPFFLMGQAQSPTKKPKVIDSPPEAHHSPKLLGLDDPGEVAGPQGLLEDMVPWMIRNPTRNSSSSFSDSSSCSSYRSPPSSPSSPSTCPTYLASCI